MGLFDFFKKKTSVLENSYGTASVIAAEKYSAADITVQLEAAGYFKYDDPADLAQLRSEIAEGLATEEMLVFVETDRRCPDLRHHHIDNEDLFEEGGMMNIIKQMNPFFEKAGIQMKVTEHLEEYDSKQQWVDQSMIMNGKAYILFEHFKGYGWGEAAQRFADMINDQLMLQQSEERMYLINGGNDGRAIFLTGELFSLLRKLIRSKDEQPMATPEWCEFCKVDYHRVV